MIESLNRQAWVELSERVVGELAPIFMTAQPKLGPEGQKLISKVLQKVSLANSRSTQDIANIIVLLDSAGNTHSAIRAAGCLRRIPFTGNQTIFEPMRQVFALAFRRLTLEGSPDAATYKQLLSYAENGGEPGPPVIREAMERRLDGVLLRHYCHEDLTSRPRAKHIANVCADIRELAVMWAFGGSATWPRSRIDNGIANCVDALKQLGALP
jgi:hypothetical protein